MRLGLAGIALLLAVTAGCLPRGEPPSGHQVIAGRQSVLAGFVPPNGDGVLRILVLRPGAEADTKDLYVVSVDGAGKPASDKLLVSGLDLTADLGCLHGLAPCALIDPGAVLVYRKGGDLVRVDPVTGDSLSWQRPAWSRSESRRRFVVSDFLNDGATLYEADGSAAVLDVAAGSHSGFVGEDFYYLTAASELRRIPPFGVAETMATDVADFRGWTSSEGAVVVLYRATGDPLVQRLSIRDPLTGREAPVPFDSAFFQGAPGGPWLLEAKETDTGRLTFFNYRSGVTRVVELPEQLWETVQFRPGTVEAWVVSRATPHNIWIVKPDAPSLSVAGVALEPVRRIDLLQASAAFTPDGAHWFSRTGADTGSGYVVQVGAADDPTGPRRDLNQPGTSILSTWALPEGRWLTAVYTNADGRSDVMALDFQTGDSRRLAERGRVAAVGQTRFMGMFHFASERGDLTVVETETGRQTILASEFTMTAFAEPQGTDLLAAGTRIVYQFQARTDSPYDGIWVVNAP